MNRSILTEKTHFLGGFQHRGTLGYGTIQNELAVIEVVGHAHCPAVHHHDPDEQHGLGEKK